MTPKAFSKLKKIRLTKKLKETANIKDKIVLKKSLTLYFFINIKII